MTPSLSQLLFFVFAAIGMTTIVVDSKIMDGFRNVWRNFWTKYDFFARWFGIHFEEVVDCHLCCGFWCGVIQSFFIVSWNPLIAFFCSGPAGAFVSSFATDLILLIQAKQVVNLPPDTDGN